MTRTILHEQTEAYKSGWARGFYGCRNDDGESYKGPAGVPHGAGRDRWLAEFWRGFFAGRAATMGRGPVRPAVDSPDDSPKPAASLTLQVLEQFAGGASIKRIADGLDITDARVEMRLRGAVSAVLRFLAERPGFFSASVPTRFEMELLTLARRIGESGSEPTSKVA
jgi:hypothetical protein